MRIKINKIIRRKPRDKEESECLYILMKAKIDDNIKKGKIRWISNREMERTIKIPQKLISIPEDNMKIEININELIQKIDVNKLIEEKIMSDVSDAIDIENIVGEALDNEEVKSHVNTIVTNIINDYMDSENGKNRIVDAFNDAITTADILNDERVIEIMAEFIKRKLTT